MKYLILFWAAITVASCSKKEEVTTPVTETIPSIAAFSDMPDGWVTGWMIGDENKKESAGNSIDTFESIVHNRGAYIRAYPTNTGYRVMAVGNPSQYTVNDSVIIAGVFNAADDLCCYIEVHPLRYKVNGVYVEQQQSFKVLDSMMQPKPPFDMQIESPGYVYEPIW